MNTIQRGLIIIGLVCALSPGVHAIAGGPTLELSSGSTTIQTGQVVTVNVSMDTKSYDVTAAEIHVSFPASAFEVVSFKAGPFLSVELAPYGTGAAAGSVILDLSVGSGTTPASGTGTAAVLVLRTLEAGTHQISILGNGVTQIAAVGESGDVSDTLTGISLTVTGATAERASGGSGGGSGSSGSTASPQATPTPTPQSAAQQAGQVPTGPGDYTVIAVLVGAITVLLYAGYMSTDHFRKQDAKAVAGKSNTETDRFDFKDKA